MAKTATAQKTTVKMVFEKATKSTFRFKSVDEDAPITTLYIAKSEFPDDVVTATLGITVQVTSA